MEEWKCRIEEGKNVEEWKCRNKEGEMWKRKKRGIDRQMGKQLVWLMQMGNLFVKYTVDGLLMNIVVEEDM